MKSILVSFVDHYFFFIIIWVLK